MTVTLRQALALASTHWATRALPGAKPSTMETFARVACEAVVKAKPDGYDCAISDLTCGDAVNLLQALRAKGLSASTCNTYYRAFRTMLKLNGRETYDWPSAPSVPRNTREAIEAGAASDCIRWLDANGYRPTAALGVILAATGMRVQREALSNLATEIVAVDPYLVLRVTGKGGHHRSIPVVESKGAAILQDPAWMAAIRAVPYRGHLNAWRKGAAAVGLKTKLATPHALRHLYACEAYRKSGGNLKMVQELLGHADPKTTSRYLHVNLDDAAEALRSP